MQTIIIEDKYAFKIYDTDFECDKLDEVHDQPRVRSKPKPHFILANLTRIQRVSPYTCAPRVSLNFAFFREINQ